VPHAVTGDFPAGAADPFGRLLSLPGVDTAATAARAAVDRLVAAAALRSAPDGVRAEMALRVARATGALAGFEIDLAEVRSGAALDGTHGALLRGSLLVSAQLGASLHTWTRAPRQTLARLHSLAAAGEVAAEELGRPVSAAAAVRLDGLAGALAAPRRAPAIVVAAVVHGEVLDSDAFGACSGTVARAASRLVLMARGLDPAGVIGIEVGHAALGLTEYQNALAGYRSATADGVATWMRHCAAAIGLAAAAALDVSRAAR
jgi:hypothetical protein